MQVQVKDWGNSQGIRLSKDILNSAGISVNEVLDVNVSNGVITLTKSFRHKTLEERAEEFGGKLMLDSEAYMKRYNVEDIRELIGAVR